jgi:ABC-type sugar transport system permease subunit
MNVGTGDQSLTSAGSVAVKQRPAVSRSGRSKEQFGRSGRRFSANKFAPYLLIAPFIIGFLGLAIFPILWSFLLSFESWSATATTWVGFRNYHFVLTDPAVATSFENLIWYVVVNDVFQITIAVGLALILDLRFMRRYSVALSAAFFLPNVVPGAAVAVIFATLLGTNGLLPGALHFIGVNINWLGSASWSKPSVILAGSWQWIGFWVIVLVAALRAVPDEYYDAAKVDGAGLFPRIWHVSLPTIRPALVFVLTVNTIGTMQLFDVPFLLFGAGGGGGPLDSATTPAVQLYNFAFGNADLGSAAATGWLLTVAIMIVTLVFLGIARRREWL